MKKVLLLIMVVLLAGCTVLGNEESSFESIKSKGTIVVGTSADYPPYEFHKVIAGKDTIVGFDVALAEKIAVDLGVELEIVDMNFEGLLPALKAGKIDFIAAGMNPTEERKESVDFTNIYYDTTQTMLVINENKDTLTSIEDFEGLKIGVQKATLQESIFDEQFIGAEKVALSKIPNLIMELQSGKIDGIILAEVVAKQYAEANADISINGMDLGSEGGVAIAVNKGQEDLLAAMNKTIETVLEDGTLDQFILDAMALAEEE
ncbi:transporter substrate-binding domain-containing protein [Acidaminobacter sp. JC074]|uniref:transporter substrate-binding domain-containing protein n=1 Tax=Acidaminobacter sp. JC074 TaxID=2530199 RepID=UPI001F0D0610|nr:transporter substrate-binding domain-containing protein [Acidaminobacter sp. JC074]MCH4890836.1 transporter substrate-binding domain-containing protein [Acidaminobacter sp. JC074]